MTTQDQCIALLEAHRAQDRARFRATALQIAAHAADKSPQFARRIREIVERTSVATGLVLLDYKDKELVTERATVPLSEVMLPPALGARVSRLLQEHREVALLAQAGVLPRRKILLSGPPGAGKSMLARALAHTLGLPLALVNLHALVGMHLGETGANVARLFQVAARHKVVMLLDEIDAVTPARDSPRHDVGEMQRVVAAVMQQFDNDESESLFVATTNQRDLIDAAMMRRFECVLEFAEPSAEMMRRLIQSRTGLDAEELPDEALARPDASAKDKNGFQARTSLALLARACDAAKRTAALEGRALQLYDVMRDFARGEEDR